MRVKIGHLRMRVKIGHLRMRVKIGHLRMRVKKSLGGFQLFLIVQLMRLGQQREEAAVYAV